MIKGHHKPLDTDRKRIHFMGTIVHLVVTGPPGRGDGLVVPSCGIQVPAKKSGLEL